MDTPDTQPTTAPISERERSQHFVHTLVLVAITVVGLYICYLLSAPFLSALTLALTLSALFLPLHRRLESRIKHPNISATLSVLIVALILVVPTTFVVEKIIIEAAHSVEMINTMGKPGAWQRFLETNPRIAPIGHWVERQFDLPGIMQAASAWLTRTATDFIQDSVRQILTLMLGFYMLFYFLRDREVMLASLRKLSPLAAMDMTRLFDEVNDIIHATFYGTLTVAAVQGTLGGLMFWWLGLPAPLLWGLAMALLAVIPVLGAFVIWIPAAIFLMLDGNGDKALILTLWGVIVVGGIDNLLYPILVGERLKMHTLVAFIAMVGGLVIFGAPGLILGPIIFTVTRLLLEIWRNQNNGHP